LASACRYQAEQIETLFTVVLAMVNPFYRETDRPGRWRLAANSHRSDAIFVTASRCFYYSRLHRFTAVPGPCVGKFRGLILYREENSAF
jgi:hypothetical protein